MLRAGIAWATFLLCTSDLTSITGQQSSFPGIQYDRGQDVSPVFDGWERNADGTFSMYFGYINRNTRTEIDVPIGPDNTFNLGNGDQGQPTHFYADGNRGRKWWVFKVIIPGDWPKDKRLVWTLTNHGRTNEAKGWLKPEYEVTQEGILFSDYRSEVQLEATADGYKSATRPMISVTAATQSGNRTLPATAKLTASATVTNPGSRGVRVQWLHYRGPGRVQFDPATTPAVKGNLVRSETSVSFSLPGSYRIRALATDGQSFSTYDFDVNVNPPTSTAR